MEDIELSIILPCRNEELTLGACIKQIKKVLKKYKIKGEIIVSDSSSDNSPRIAIKEQVKLIKHDKQGYGIAYLEAIKVAKGRYIFMADCDGTYDFNEVPKFLGYLKKDYNLVIGNRFKGDIKKGAMSWHHKYLGNPIISFFSNFFFKLKIHDINCGMRAIKREDLIRLNLKTTGMEFASEMIIKANKQKLKIKEIPITYYKRKGISKLSSFRDGWRHLRFMLMYAPTHLFLIPGIMLFVIGSAIMIAFLSNPIKIFNIPLYNRPMILGSFFTILGYQIISLGIYTKAYMKSLKFIESDRLLDTIAKVITFETGIIIGILMLIISFLMGTNILSKWISTGFPGLTDNTLLFVLTLSILSIQTMFSAFFLSILVIEKK